MKTLGNIIAYGSLVLNVYYLAVWLYVFNAYDTHAERQQALDAYVISSNALIAVILILLSILSLVILARKPTIVPKVLSVLQSFFIFLYGWQFL